MLYCADSSPVPLKMLLCVLFVFFNRSQRVLRNRSVLVEGLDIKGVAVLPLLASGILHMVLMCSGLVVPARAGRLTVFCALLHIFLLHACAMLMVTVALDRYMNTASFLSILLSSHFCYSVKPMIPRLVQSQKFAYQYITKFAAYIIPITCWVILPVLPVHELEAIVLLFLPEALCFVFVHCVYFFTLILQVAVVSICSVSMIGNKED
jgi:hypothetical protein